MVGDPLDPCPDVEALDRFASGRIKAEMASSISEHLMSCSTCSTRLDNVKRNLAAASDYARVFPDGCAWSGLITKPSSTAVPDAQAAGSRDAPATVAGMSARIGEFEIIREIGRGGMGIVYEAQQRQPTRRVALKIIRDDFISAEALRRFEHESQALGRLQHPGIAQIIRAGTAETPLGRRPFFAMELVSGTPLHDHIQRSNPTRRERLQLVAQVCDAIQHAHQQGVIHRDLKPGNVLVVGDSESGNDIKVLDFGVARLTDSDLQTTTQQTDIGRLIGTIPYMSPEQVTGDPAALDTRSDVYAIGVMAYQLLTGRLPYDLDPRSIPDAVRAIREDEPVAPRTIDRSLGGDIETLLLTALEKDKSRRYQTAGELAADIRRFLNDLPLAARSPSAWYQIAKFARRHRILLGASCTIVVILFAATVVSIGLASRALNAESRVRRQLAMVRDAKAQAEAGATEARDQTAKAHAVNEFLEDMLASANPEETGGRADLSVRDVLDAAEKKLNDGSLQNEPGIEAMVRTTIGNTWRALGEYDRAVGILARAAELGRAAHPAGHEDVARSLNKLGRAAQEKGDYERAGKAFRECLEMRRRLLGDEHEDVATILNNIGELERLCGRYAQALEYHEQAIALRRKLFGDRHESVANSLNNLGAVLYAMGDFPTAEALLRESLDIDRRIRGEMHPNVSSTMLNLANAMGAQDKNDEAVAMIRRALKLRRAVYGDSHPEIATAVNNLAVRLAAMGKLDEAEQQYREALAMVRNLRGPRHPVVATTLTNLAQLVQKRNRTEEALNLLQESLEINSEVLGANHPATLDTTFQIARIHLGNREYDRAATLFESLLPRMRASFPENDFHIAACTRDYGRSLAHLGRLNEAEPHLIDSFEIFRERLGPAHRATKFVVQLLVALYEKQGRESDADTWEAMLAIEEE